MTNTTTSGPRKDHERRVMDAWLANEQRKVRERLAHSVKNPLVKAQGPPRPQAQGPPRPQTDKVQGRAPVKAQGLPCQQTDKGLLAPGGGGLQLDRLPSSRGDGTPTRRMLLEEGDNNGPLTNGNRHLTLLTQGPDASQGSYTPQGLRDKSTTRAFQSINSKQATRDESTTQALQSDPNPGPPILTIGSNASTSTMDVPLFNTTDHSRNTTHQFNTTHPFNTTHESGSDVVLLNTTQSINRVPLKKLKANASTIPFPPR